MEPLSAAARLEAVFQVIGDPPLKWLNDSLEGVSGKNDLLDSLGETDALVLAERFGSDFDTVGLLTELRRIRATRVAVVDNSDFVQASSEVALSAVVQLRNMPVVHRMRCLDLISVPDVIDARFYILFGKAIEVAVTDKAQLCRPVDPANFTDSVEYMMRFEAEDIRASLQASDERATLIISALYGWQQYLGCKGCKLTTDEGSYYLTFPSDRFLLATCPVTGGPSYIVDHEAFQMTLQTILLVPVRVIPGSYFMACTAGYLAMHYKYTRSERTIRCTPSTQSGAHYKGIFSAMVLNVHRRKLNDFMITHASNYAPPQSLLAREKLMDYLCALVGQAIKDGRIEVIEDSRVCAILQTLYNKKMLDIFGYYRAYPNITSYLNACKNGKLRALAGVATATNMCINVVEERRKVQNNFPIAEYTNLTHGCAAIPSALVADRSSTISKFADPLRWLVAIAGRQSNIDVTGIATGHFVSVIKEILWDTDAADRKFNMYDIKPDQYTAETNAVIARNIFSDGYPSTARMLVDDVMGEASSTKYLELEAKCSRVLLSSYNAGVIKLMMGPTSVMGKRGDAFVFPCEIEKIIMNYEKWELFSTGRAHNVEFFLTFFGRLEMPVALDPKMLGRIMLFFYSKMALCSIANAWKDLAFALGYLMPLTPKILADGGSVPLAAAKAVKWLGLEVYPDRKMIGPLAPTTAGYNLLDFAGQTVDFEFVDSSVFDDTSGKGKDKDVVKGEVTTIEL